MATVSRCNIHHKISTSKGFDDPCGLAIGSFDGVHLGHQAIVRRVVDESRQLGLKARLLTFYPRPSEFFAPKEVRPSLMSWREKVCYLAGMGLDDVICMPFNRRLSQLSAEAFVEEILLRGLNAKFMSVGEDFQFGAKRLGNTSLLKNMGKKLGFRVAIAETQTHNSDRISSTRIREALLSGETESAGIMLGRPYRLSGRVVRGRQLGRQMGVPTANLHLKRARLCVNGVFAVRVWLGQKSYAGVANIGFRPAVDNLEKPLLEVHLFDFAGDLYGQYLEVDILHKIREEQGFESLQLLKDQIMLDIKKAREWLENHPERQPN